MILFFSATGNCKYVATRLAQAFNQEMLSITDCIEKTDLLLMMQASASYPPPTTGACRALLKNF